MDRADACYQSATEEEIRAFCQSQIAHHKAPRYVRFVPEFPMTATGKPQQFVMREQFMREMGTTDAKTG